MFSVAVPFVPDTAATNPLEKTHSLKKAGGKSGGVVIKAAMEKTRRQLRLTPEFLEHFVEISREEIEYK